MYYNSNDDLYRQEMLMSYHHNRDQVRVNEQAQYANEKRQELVNATYRSADRSKKLNSFLVESKNMLLTEAIYKLVKGSLPETVSESLLSTAKNITTNFVMEEGADNLLNRFKTKTCFLSEMSNIVIGTYDKVVEAAKETFEDDFTIKNSDLEAFYSRLDQLDYDKMTTQIRDKVAKAENEFIQANADDRAKMEDLAEKTKEKLDAVKAKDQETEDLMKQEQTRLYKANLHGVLDRKKSLLEALVTKTSESIIKDSVVKESYTLESGKLNASAIIDTAEIMYTFLEAVNTAKIKDMTPDYINKVINSI